MKNEKLKKAADIAGRVGYKGMIGIRNSLIGVYLFSGMLYCMDKCGHKLPEINKPRLEIIADTAYTNKYGENIFLKDVDKDGNIDLRIIQSADGTKQWYMFKNNAYCFSVADSIDLGKEY